jgi:hypothetical protein
MHLRLLRIVPGHLFIQIHGCGKGRKLEGMTENLPKPIPPACMLIILSNMDNFPYAYIDRFSWVFHA